MRNAYITALYDLACKDNRVYALVADNGAIVYDKFRERFSDRFINFGISEANMVSCAAGFSSCGKIPFIYTISCFITMRAFEQVRNDVCLQKMNVKLVGTGSGFIYSNLGPTHHATEDITLMRSLPNLTVFSPCDDLETINVTKAAAEIIGPVYIRLATGKSPEINKKDYNFKIGKGVVLNKGTDITIISTGGILFEVFKAVKEMEKMNISVNLINLHTIKPIDKNLIIESANKTKTVITVEEHTILGGLGSLVAEIILENCSSRIKFKRLGLNDLFSIGYGSYEDMKEMNELSKYFIIKKSLKLLER